MANRMIVPFGPQHPVLPEPIHLDLVLEDDKVVEAIPSLGFVHRGLEQLVAKKDFIEMSYVAERICGICSFIHGMGYCQAVEAVMNIEIPPRAKYLRVFWSELSRIHSHLLWLGLMADAAGFESLFMHSWRVRERIVNIIEETTGGRVIFGSTKVGGTRRDVDNELLQRIAGELDDIAGEIGEITAIFEDDYSLKHRLEGLGVLPGPDALKLGAVGPVLRASGIAADTRRLGYAAYGDLNWETVVQSAGDCQARVLVRVKEIGQSFHLLRQVIQKIPDGPVEVKVAGTPNGEHFARLEQPRGEVVYYVKGNGTRNLDRFRVRTPTFANVAPLVKLLQGCQFADVALIVLTIDPCISCAER